MARTPLAAAVVLLSVLTLAGCSGSSNPMGPETPEPPEKTPAPGPAIRVEMEGPSSDSLTLKALTDTVQLSVRAYDEEGREIPDPEVQWATSDPEVFEVTEDGGVWRQPNEDEVFEGGDDRDSVPDSPGPLPATITATVDGAEEAREFVQTSPTTWVNVSPDGTCQLAPGTYEDSHSDRVVTIENPVVLEAEIDARDYYGRTESVAEATWRSTDTSVATVERHPTEARRTRIEITSAGMVDIEGTVNDITDAYEIEVSDEVEWDPDGSGSGKVKCSTGPSFSVQAGTSL